jgi:hypothetical protein
MSIPEASELRLLLAGDVLSCAGQRLLGAIAILVPDKIRKAKIKLKSAFQLHRTKLLSLHKDNFKLKLTFAESRI